MSNEKESEQHLCEALVLLGCARATLTRLDDYAADDLRREINEFAAKVTGRKDI